MQEAADITELARKEPDRTRAVFAINAASHILDVARERFYCRDYRGAFQESKNAIRMASSALLFRDGYIASTLDATLMHMEENYLNQLPIEEWQSLESMITGVGPGLLNLIIRLTGKDKKTGRAEAGMALMVAERFLASTDALMVLR